MALTIDLPATVQEKAEALAIARGERNVEELMLALLEEALENEQDAREAAEAYAAYVADPTQVRPFEAIAREMEDTGAFSNYRG